MPEQHFRGFVYVATGAGYVQEAVRSARSLKDAMPTAHVTLITDQTSSEPCFNAVLPASDCVHGPIDKTLAVNADYDRIMFVDTDTLFAGDVMEAFEVLDRFDFALAHELKRGWNYLSGGVPRPFCEFNTGVMLFRRTPEVREFFRMWRQNYEGMKPQLAVPKNDQPSFRKTAYESPLRIAVLPNEFNFVTDAPNSTGWEARILHGRSDLERANVLVNGVEGPRAYLPGIGALEPYRGRRSAIRSAARFLSGTIRQLIQGADDPTTRCPNRWW